MAQSKQLIISAINRVKDKDGNYVVILPVNTIEEVFVDLNTGVTLSQILDNVVEQVNDARLTTVEDLASVINMLSGLIDNRIELNHIYRDNFKDDYNLDISKGKFTSGGIKIIQGEELDFKLKNPIKLKFLPTEFKVTQMCKYIGGPGITCLITFNALDTKPTWYDCTDVLTTGLFAKVPEIANKEADKDYAINVRFICSCDGASTYEIMDMSVLYA